MKRWAIAAIVLLASCRPPEVNVAAPMTRLEVHPEVLSIPVGQDRDIHIEPFSYDTPLWPADVEFWVSSGGDVAMLRHYKTPILTIRGLKVGDAEVMIAVGEELQVRIPVVVTDEVSAWTVDQGTPKQADFDAALAHRLLGAATGGKAPQDVLDALCRWIQSCVGVDDA